MITMIKEAIDVIKKMIEVALQYLLIAFTLINGIGTQDLQP